MNVRLLTIGDELLIGQVVDSNAAWMARHLNAIGARVLGKETVGDSEEEIAEALRRALDKADVVLMTGGLGPTKDDITKKALAAFFGEGFVFSQETYDHIVRFMTRLGREASEVHRDQCFMPQSAVLLRNRMGTAPGMWFEHEGKVLASMPGVPYEMEYIMEHEVLPRLQQRFPASPIIHRTFSTAGEGETRIADRLKELEDSLPNEVKLAYLPGLGQVRLRLTARGADAVELQRILDQQTQRLRDLLPDLIYGQDEETLEEVVGKMLKARNWTIATAESCTGGFLAHRITSLAGASDYFKGSVIAYSNEVKTRLLGVKDETLLHHGAVSEQTVVEMAAGARALLGVDVAIAISGIAGPGGGTTEKPVGTIWIAVGSAEKTIAHRLQLGKDRLKNIHYATIFALNLAWKFLRAD
jgi:nicotinamide-nucleotide amidase